MKYIIADHGILSPTVIPALSELCSKPVHQISVGNLLLKEDVKQNTTVPNVFQSYTNVVLSDDVSVDLLKDFDVVVLGPTSDEDEMMRLLHRVGFMHKLHTFNFVLVGMGNGSDLISRTRTDGVCLCKLNVIRNSPVGCATGVCTMKTGTLYLTDKQCLVYDGNELTVRG